MNTLKKILHIDDDSVMRMMVKKSLERSGHDFEIINCATGTEFLEHLSSFKPDLLIIDVIMPVLEGPDLLRKLRDMQDQTPAIFMTGQDDIDFKDREILEPILGILHKPFAPAQLGDNILSLWNNQKEVA